MRRVVFIIAEKVFRDEEYQVPKDILTQAGHQVVTASTTTKEAVGKLGMKVQPDMLVTDIVVDEFDAVVFIGGGGAAQYFDSLTAHQLAKQALDHGAVVAAICIAPVILAKAGLLKSRAATVYPDGAEILKAHGACYTGNTVELDGRILTGNGPEAAEEFGQALVALV